jgi:hypothetical protein
MQAVTMNIRRLRTADHGRCALCGFNPQSALYDLFMQDEKHMAVRRAGRVVALICSWVT